MYTHACVPVIFLSVSVLRGEESRNAVMETSLNKMSDVRAGVFPWLARFPYLYFQVERAHYRWFFYLHHSVLRQQNLGHFASPVSFPSPVFSIKLLPGPSPLYLPRCSRLRSKVPPRLTYPSTGLFLLRRELGSGFDLEKGTHVIIVLGMVQVVAPVGSVHVGVRRRRLDGRG